MEELLERAATLTKEESFVCALCEELPSAIRAEASLAYSVTMDADSAQLLDLEQRGVNRSAEATRKIFEQELLEQRDGRWGWYNIVQPEPWQRNRAFSRGQLEKAVPLADTSRGKRMLRGAGLERLDFVRAIVCPDEQSLGWVGGWREAPFSAEEVDQFQQLVPLLRLRFALEVQQRLLATYSAAFEALPYAALLVSDSGHVREANTLGTEWLDNTRYSASLISSLVSEEAGCRPGSAKRSPDLQILRLQRSVARDGYLILGTPRSAFGERWSLTKREREILPLILQGLSNKEIAETQGCSHRTVEIHVSKILRKSGHEDRKALLASFVKR